MNVWSAKEWSIIEPTARPFAKTMGDMNGEPKQHDHHDYTTQIF